MAPMSAIAITNIAFFISFTFFNWLDIE